MGRGVEQRRGEAVRRGERGSDREFRSRKSCTDHRGIHLRISLKTDGKAEWDFWFEGKPATVDIYSPFGKLMEKVGTVRDGGSYKNRMGRIAVWNSVMDENEYLTDRWNEFMAS